LWCFKLLSFITGSATALLSQIILSRAMWLDMSALHSQSTMDVIYFSLLWSFWTCVMIFITMMVLVAGIQRCGMRRIRLSDKKWEDVLFQIEAHHIVGSLLTISLIWIVVDVLQSFYKFGHHHNNEHGDASTADSNVMPTIYQNAVYFLIAIAWYALFVRCICKKSSKDTTETKSVAVETAKPIEEREESADNESLLSTYQMIAATLGLISGLCSQFLLSFILWKDHMSRPIIDHVVLFSILWSFATVVLTFFGCLSLRLLTVDEDNKLDAERIFLRMESHYVFSSLIGICLAWILIDLVMDMSEQIVPSICMLAVSLIAFCAILHCFPEDKCLADFQSEVEASSKAPASKVDKETQTGKSIQIV